MPNLNHLTSDVQLYTRYEHGNHPVRVLRDDRGTPRYEVARTEGVQVYRSARQLIAAQYGRPRSMTFDAYFKIGRYRRRGRPSGAADLLTLFGRSSSARTPIVVQGPASLKRSTAIVVDVEEDGFDVETRKLAEVVKEVSPATAVGFEPPPGVTEEFDRVLRLELDRLQGLVGIDLAERSGRSGALRKADEVRKLLWAGFAGKMLSQGYDPDDILQEVYRGLLVRNRGKCPWDHRKSTFGHYVFLVVNCLLTNYHRKESRRAERDAISIEADTRLGGTCSAWTGTEIGDQLAIEDLARFVEGREDGSPEAALAIRILPLVGAGHSRSEIAELAKVRAANVSRALTWLRKQSAAWAVEGGLDGYVPLRYRSQAWSPS